MKQQLLIFLTAVMFYTRIPCPAWVDHSEDYLNKATIYFPVIGWIAGITGAVFYWGGTFAFNIEISITVSMVAGILLTGAFHEDGFADVCDGFGGGWTKEKILEIMKDSRVGAYGAMGLVLMLGLKFLLLVTVLQKCASFLHVALLLMTVHALSRFAAVVMIYTHTYARENEDGKAKPVAKKLAASELAVAFLFAVLPLAGLAWLTQNPLYALVFVPLGLVKWYLGRYFQRWIGGYTGDCLGATQQVAEIAAYLFFASTLWN